MQTFQLLLVLLKKKSSALENLPVVEIKFP